MPSNVLLVSIPELVLVLAEINFPARHNFCIFVDDGITREMEALQDHLIMLLETFVTLRTVLEQLTTKLLCKNEMTCTTSWWYS